VEVYLFYKPEIRSKMQQRRKALQLPAIKQAAELVAAQVIQLRSFLEASHIGCYLSIEGELDPMPIMQCADSLKKQLYLPVIANTTDPHHESLQFYGYNLGDPLFKGLHGISAPAHRTALPRDVAELDLIIAPLVAFDSDCNRLGRGAGHYDRTLNAIKQRHGRLPYLIGLAYEFQKVPQIVTDKWDVPFDTIVTEKNIYSHARP
jgi:5-formyltetrahydrofolate cyclo-ligase